MPCAQQPRLHPEAPTEVASKVSAYYRTSPMHGDPRQPVPNNLAIRYVLEDVAFCFAGWAALGARLGVPTPTLDAFVTIYQSMRARLGGPSPLTLADLGLDTTDAAALRNLRAAQE